MITEYKLPVDVIEATIIAHQSDESYHPSDQQLVKALSDYKMQREKDLV